MSLKDKFNNFIDYFTEDGEEVEVREAKAAGAETQPVPQPQPTPQVTSPRPQISQREPVKPKPTPVAPVTTPVSTAAVNHRHHQQDGSRQHQGVEPRQMRRRLPPQSPCYR